MSRILALDFGAKRVGVAISDPLGIFAQGLDTLYIRGKTDLLSKLSRYFNSYEIDEVIIGNPLNSQGEDSKLSQEIKRFAKILSENREVKVTLWDERYSTKEAENTLKSLNSRNIKSQIDKVAAQIILQSYLERLRSERDIEDT
ncbi:MAG: Holliday junction resolvase RuvX [Candidatus Kaelpia aquatica]|nr:Holliday junction resolvase RuvX [Candidatus Kaelpia aquatica]